MHLDRLWLSNFRNYASIDVAFPSAGTIAIVGENGQGKSNLLEAIGYVATLRSFRAASSDTLVRVGFEAAVVRGEGVREGRELLIENELRTVGRNRTLINRQPLRRSQELNDTFLATVFSPDDLCLIKDGPSHRREYVDQLSADTNFRSNQNQRDVDRILKQRNTLLKQAGGRLTSDIETTLEVWDTQFSEAGEALGNDRAKTVDQITPYINAAYRSIAKDSTNTFIGLSLESEWRAEQGGKGLADALLAARKVDVARGVTTVGPHRDELHISLSGMPARTHASQGEQRTLALALRLAAHLFLTNHTGVPPLLLLDDVFSELDLHRSRALLEQLPQAQSFLTTAGFLPEGIEPAAILHVKEGELV